MRNLFCVLLAMQAAFGAGELSNRRAPGFSLPDFSYKQQYDPQDFRGKVVVLEIMQTTCPHCLRFSAILEEARAKYGPRIQILSIVIPPDNQATVSKYAADHKVQIPVLFDCGQVTASYLKITPQNPSFGVPHVFLIDQQGMIRNDFKYEEQTVDLFEGRRLFAELDRLLGAVPGKK